jgi:hypothetical protein
VKVLSEENDKAVFLPVAGDRNVAYSDAKQQNNRLNDTCKPKMMELALAQCLPELMRSDRSPRNGRMWLLSE